MSEDETVWIKSGDKTDVSLHLQGAGARLPVHLSKIFNRRLPITTLFVGPYTHEFGHELFSFQGYAREQSKYCEATEQPYEKVIVSCRDDMRFLYEDFATDFVTIEEAELLNYSKETKADQIYHADIPKSFPTNKLITHISQSFCMSSVRKGTGVFKHGQSFVQYGKLNRPAGGSHLNFHRKKYPDSYDIIVHARQKKGRMSINLSNEDYDAFSKELSSTYRIAFTGLKSQAYCPEGVDDLRGIPLSRLANVIRSSRLVFGQSSGPIHFASLCGTPHFTWGGYRLRTYIRYAHHWNPFKTLCFLLESPSDGYLKNRARMAKLPRDILDADYFNVIETKKYRHPPISELILWIKEVLNSNILNGYNEKRALCRAA